MLLKIFSFSFYTSYFSKLDYGINFNIYKFIKIESVHMGYLWKSEVMNTCEGCIAVEVVTLSNESTYFKVKGVNIWPCFCFNIEHGFAAHLFIDFI